MSLGLTPQRFFLHLRLSRASTSAYRFFATVAARSILNTNSPMRKRPKSDDEGNAEMKTPSSTRRRPHASHNRMRYLEGNGDAARNQRNRGRSGRRGRRRGSGRQNPNREARDNAGNGNMEMQGQEQRQEQNGYNMGIMSGAGFQGPSGYGVPSMMPFMPFTPQMMPGYDLMAAYNGNPAIWNAMNMPFMPAPIVNPNFSNLMTPMFNPTMPMFNSFDATCQMGSLDTQSQGQPARHSNSPASVVAAPSATDQYHKQASLPSIELSTPQPLLVILDLNGTLVNRKARKFPPVFTKRVGLEYFLENLLQNYKVMIWSSSQPNTVRAVCKKLFSGVQRKMLVAEWGRDKFGLTNKQYRSKTQVYKTLETVWADPDIQATYPLDAQNETNNNNTSSPKKWDQSNTILIDDSKLKAISEPYNILEIPEFTDKIKPTSTHETHIFPKVLDRLQALSTHDDISKLMRSWSTSNNPNILDYELDGNHAHLVGCLGSMGSEVAQDPARARQQKQEMREHQKTKKAAQEKRAKRAGRKAEKKALKKALKEGTANANATINTDGAGAGGASGPTLATTIASAGAVTVATTLSEKQGRREEEQIKKRSPSPPTPTSPVSASSAPSASGQSENNLLDRLEESLNG